VAHQPSAIRADYLRDQGFKTNRMPALRSLCWFNESPAQPGILKQRVFLVTRTSDRGLHYGESLMEAHRTQMGPSSEPIEFSPVLERTSPIPIAPNLPESPPSIGARPCARRSNQERH